MPTSNRVLSRIATNRLFSSSSASSSKTSQERWARRCRLLDASRCLLAENNGSINDSASPGTKKRPLPVFPLEARHFGGHNYPSNNATTTSLPPNTPQEFHGTLCEMIRNAKDRVRIASLYVGPAISKQDDCEEAELLQALSEIVDRNHSNGDKKVSIKIVLDENRALRPIPINHPRTSDEHQSKTTTSSAEAVARAIQGGNAAGCPSSSLRLFRVLPPTTIARKNWLPNPLNEVAGVFHIKIYIVDDQLLLSGANLSREYFKDRMDRYLHLVEGANGLVDFYAELVDIICRHSNEYVYQGPNNGTPMMQTKNKTAEFLREITKHFQDTSSLSASPAEDLFAIGSRNENGTAEGENDIVAFGIPTFQAPSGYFRYKDPDDTKNVTPISVAKDIATAFSTCWSLFRIDQRSPDKVDFVTDVEATLNLLRTARNMNTDPNGKNKHSYSVHLSSAYLNPTKSLLSVVQENFRSVELLTAGKISHGFKPKQKDCKEGSQGTDWTIPSIFDKLVEECMTALRSSSSTTDARLFYWERPGWTFHAKGIWIKDHQVGDGTQSNSSEVAAVVVGSSNFGFRSFCRDMESNLVVVFPPTATDASSSEEKSISHSFGDEWKDLLTSSKAEVVETGQAAESATAYEPGSAEKVPPLPWPILKSIPIIKTFF